MGLEERGIEEREGDVNDRGGREEEREREGGG